VDRFAVFVDAGYALTAGARIAWGYPVPRSAVTVDYREFVDKLIQTGQAACSQDLLRVYWYDGAIDQVPTTQHQTLGDLPNVKVRLGRLVGGGQKGVDTLIVLDLTTLDRERAISTAFVMSGDEDLREGVAVAQQLGVRVVLWGLEPVPSNESNQALTLIREADTHTVLASPDFITPCFTQVQRVARIAVARNEVVVETAPNSEPAASSPYEVGVHSLPYGWHPARPRPRLRSFDRQRLYIRAVFRRAWTPNYWRADGYK
jgi:uncharacterized LabA/DUF88 family protein